ncbi:hypothetical protein TEA_010949 [Camellia sinensis var. sinensis]|uniref:Uncharacterized protein n=1 Tax=Camellia sinensis var. sinensis TaxID=542762 RepID=A0A4S4EYK8_CAMSN|nr:hypothetical protein TEA_010949 [Camellia sinensis var. sinensis]
MLSGLMGFLRACFRPRSDRYIHAGLDTVGRQDGLLWYKDTGQHFSGEFSMAVVQANNLLEDQSQIESGCLSTNDLGPFGTFVGVYDGHGGPETSRFVNDHLFQHLKIISFNTIESSFQNPNDAITKYLTFGNPNSCCEKLENLLTRGLVDGQLELKEEKSKQQF